jgi:hypothetical protein
LRQAYDYWQDQPGLSVATEEHTPTMSKTQRIVWLSSRGAKFHISQSSIWNATQRMKPTT